MLIPAPRRAVSAPCAHRITRATAILTLWLAISAAGGTLLPGSQLRAESVARPQPKSPAQPEQKQKPAAVPEIQPYRPTPAELEAARKRIALRQYTAQLVVAYKYQIKASVPYLMRQLKTLAPESPEYRYFQAIQLYENEKRGRALILLAESVYAAPLFSRAWNLQGIVLTEADRLPEAQTSFEKAVEHNPYNPNYVYNLASVQYRRGQLPAALNSSERAIRLKPNLAEAYYLKGRVHRDTQATGPALLAFKQAADFGLKTPDFLLDYMLVAEAAGDDKIVPDLAERLSTTRDPRTLRELARIHASFGEYREAARYSARLLGTDEAKPDDRQRYVFALHRLHKKNKPAVLAAIARIPKVKKEERKELEEYYRKLAAGERTKPGTRDPMLKPLR
mgnify:CR=1 FL=1